jgi:hypothetical protein
MEAATRIEQPGESSEEAATCRNDVKVDAWLTESHRVSGAGHYSLGSLLNALYRFRRTRSPRILVFLNMSVLADGTTYSATFVASR